MKVTKHIRLTFFSTLILLVGFTEVSAQEDEVNQFVKKQFYGNRIKAGSIAFSAGFQRSDNLSDDADGVTGEIGLGLGVGLSERFVFSTSYSRIRIADGSAISQGIAAAPIQTSHNFSIGIVYLFNTLGGFIQPYVGADFLISEINFKDDIDDDPFRIQTFGGGAIRGGVTCWISTFMAIGFEPLSLTLAGRIGEDEDFNGQLDADLALLNPTVRISFLINGKKP